MRYIIIFILMMALLMPSRVQAIGTAGRVYTDTSSEWTYTGSWAYQSGVPTYAGTDHYTSTVGDYATLQFSGSGFTMLYITHQSRGKMEIRVDGTLITTINAYVSSGVNWQAVYHSPTFSNGAHTLTVKNVSSANGYYIDVEGIQILFPTPSDIPAVENQGNLHLFALLGQSNMVGADAIPLIQPQSPTIYNFANNDRWQIGIEPIDNSAAVVDSVSSDTFSGYSPAMAFALRMQQLHPDWSIGLIPCAKGGSGIMQWQRNLSENSLYGSCLKRIKAASVMGTIDGLFFWQGETDAYTQSAADAWGANFAQFVFDFRSDFGNVPVVFVQIGNLPPATFPYYQDVQNQQAAINLSDVYMVSAIGLPTLSDGVHVTVAGQQTIGAQAANALP